MNSQFWCWNSHYIRWVNHYNGCMGDRYMKYVLLMNIIRWLVLSYLVKTKDSKRMSENHICLRLHNQRDIWINNEKMPILTDHQYKENVSLQCLSLSRMVQNTHLVSFLVIASTASHLSNYRNVDNRSQILTTKSW